MNQPKFKDVIWLVLNFSFLERQTNVISVKTTKKATLECLLIKTSYFSLPVINTEINTFVPLGKNKSKQKHWQLCNSKSCS